MVKTLIISTEIGHLTIKLNYEKSLHTAGYFAEETLKGTFEGGSVFRIVTEANASMRQNSKIEVIQMGVNWPEDKANHDILHEPTSVTGLKHKKWTVSAARFALHKNHPSFFICIRDEPVLDEGSPRHPDGHGFTAFGELVGGFEVADKIFPKAEPEEFMHNEIKIHSARLS
ncbi:MAG: peptidylprolyl isomerase [Litorimonas sp.]